MIYRFQTQEKLDPFHTTGFLLYSLKTLKKQRFSDVLREYKKKLIAWNGLRRTCTSFTLGRTENYYWFALVQDIEDIKNYKLHCVKSVQIWSYFWSVFSCIRAEYKKIWTRKISVFWHFSCSIVRLREYDCKPYNFFLILAFLIVAFKIIVIYPFSIFFNLRKLLLKQFNDW